MENKTDNIIEDTLAQEIIKLHLEKYGGQILTKRPEGMLYEAYVLHRRGQNQFLKNYLKGRLVYPGKRRVPLKNKEGDIEKYVTLKGIPFKGKIKTSKGWKETV